MPSPTYSIPIHPTFVDAKQSILVLEDCAVHVCAGTLSCSKSAPARPHPCPLGPDPSESKFCQSACALLRLTECTRHILFNVVKMLQTSPQLSLHSHPLATEPGAWSDPSCSLSWPVIAVSPNTNISSGCVSTPHAHALQPFHGQSLFAAAASSSLWPNTYLALHNLQLIKPVSKNQQNRVHTRLVLTTTWSCHDVPCL